jgi:hypothetical protein
MFLGSLCGQERRLFLSLWGFLGGAVPEAEAVVSGLQDMAMVREAIEERRRHFGVTEHRGPFAEAEIGGDDDAGSLVKFAEQVEQQGAARGTERQIAEFVEDDEVGVDEAARDLTGLSLGFLLFEGVDQFDGREEAGTLFAMLDCLDAKRCGDVILYR